MNRDIRSARGFVGWLRPYDRSLLTDDVRAGLVVAVMLVPQSMAYAAIAGMPPISGLYASTVPLVVYALLGSSRQLAVGPVAIVSLLTAAGLAPLAQGDVTRYAQLAALLAVMVGVLQIGFGLLNLGALTNLLSHPVLAGFTSGAALLIAMSQVRSLVGLDLPRPDGFIPGVVDVIRAAGDVHWPTIWISVVAIGFLIAGKRVAPRFPTPILVVGGAILAITFTALGNQSIAVIGDVPSGLPVPRWISIDLDSVRGLIPTALTVAFIGYAEGISIAKTMAARTRHRVIPNRELIATGGANLAAGLFQAFPVAGGFSRTAVNYQAGARTNLAGIVTAAGVAVSLLVLTPFFVDLPKAVLAAIVVVAVMGLIDLRSIPRTFRIRGRDGIAQLLTLTATLLLGVELGIGVGVASSLALFVWSSTTPHSPELGRVVGSTVFRNTTRYNTVTDPHVVLMRLDGPIYFANIGYLRDRLINLVTSSYPQARALVLDASAVSEMDASAAHGLEEVLDAMDEAGVALHLATVRGPVREVLVASGLWDRLGTDRIHADIARALAAMGYPEDGPLLHAMSGERLTVDLY